MTMLKNHEGKGVAEEVIEEFIELYTNLMTEKEHLECEIKKLELEIENPNTHQSFKIFASIEIIRDALSSDKVDLGIDYKKKYEELVELLEPHKIDESMEPLTTLKMLLKYHK